MSFAGDASVRRLFYRSETRRQEMYVTQWPSDLQTIAIQGCRERRAMDCMQKADEANLTFKQLRIFIFTPTPRRLKFRKNCVANGKKLFEIYGMLHYILLRDVRH